MRVGRIGVNVIMLTAVVVGIVAGHPAVRAVRRRLTGPTARINPASTPG